MVEYEYSAGSCNIGESEIKQRRRIGYLGLILAIIAFIIYIGMIYLAEMDPLYGIVIFVPVLVSSTGFFQARNKFCAAYGFTRQQNVSNKLGVTIKIEDKISQQKDRNKAIRIVLQAFLISIVTTIGIIIIGSIIRQIT